MRYLLQILTAMFFVACTNSSSKPKEITGKWKPVDFKSDKVTVEETQEMMKTAIVEFTASNNYYTFINDKKEEEGSFTIDKKQQQLTVTNRLEKQVYSINWSGDTLVLTNQEKETMKLLKK